MRILVLGKIDPAGLEILEKHFELSVRPYLDGPELLDILPDYDAILMRVDQLITRQVLERATRLRIIAVASVGVDHIDLEAAAERGLLVFNSPGGNAASVAEYAFGLILNLVKKLVWSNNDMKAGVFDRVKYPATELGGKTLGIIGLGNVGTKVARIALGFGMKVIADDPYVRIVYDPDDWDPNRPSGKIELVGLDELLKRSDVVTIHCPLTDETRRLISARELSLMRPHAYLINTARGPIVDQEALRDALVEKRIAGAALDVHDHEPKPGIAFRSPLLGLDDCVCLLSPHIAGSTPEAYRRMAIIAAERIVDEARRLGLWEG